MGFYRALHKSNGVVGLYNGFLGFVEGLSSAIKKDYIGNRRIF